MPLRVSRCPRDTKSIWHRMALGLPDLRSRRMYFQPPPYLSEAEEIRRRILVTLADATQIIIELAAFTETYEAPISHAVRAYGASVEDGTLVLETYGIVLNLPGSRRRDGAP